MSESPNAAAQGGDDRREAPIAGLPPWAGPGWRWGFCALTPFLLLVAFALPSVTRRAILYRQSLLEENAVWLAIEALEGDDGPRTAPLVEKALNTTVMRETMGDAPMVMAPQYLELAEALIERGRIEQGRRALFKATRHYQRVPRPLENRAIWTALMRLYAADDPQRFLHVFDLIGSHSLFRLVEFLDWSRTEGLGLDPALASYARLRNDLHNRGPEPIVRALDVRHLEAQGPDLQIAIDSITIRALIESGSRARALELAEALAARFPGRLEPMALAALARDRTDPAIFASELEDPRFRVLDFEGLTPAPTEYSPPRDFDARGGGSALMRRKGSAELVFDLDAPAERLYVIAWGSDFLDIFPLALVSIDGGEEFPLYADHNTSEVMAIDRPLEAGSHTIRFEYLNDFDGSIEGKRFNRDLMLQRLVIQYAGASPR